MREGQTRAIAMRCFRALAGQGALQSAIPRGRIEELITAVLREHGVQEKEIARDERTHQERAGASANRIVEKLRGATDTLDLRENNHRALVRGIIYDDLLNEAMDDDYTVVAGDVVQMDVNANDPHFAGCLLFVESVTEDRVGCYALLPGIEPRARYYKYVMRGEYSRVGHATWTEVES